MIYLNTKEDYLNLLQSEPMEAREQLQELLDDRYAWKSMAVLEKKEDGLEDETHRILEQENEFIQAELLEDEYAKIFRLGFTVEEVEKLINGEE